jgi:hypothetical protein
MSVVIFWSMLACKAIEPAPTELDDLAHYFWRDFDAEGELLAPGLVNLHSAIGGDDLEDKLDGSISDLSADQLELVGMGDLSPSRPAGIFIANVVNCSLEELEEHSYALNQGELHDGTYESYDRSYTSDFGAYTSGQVDSLEWESTYAVKGLGVEYAATIDGRMRYLPAIDAESSPYGDAVFVRGVLAEPAYIEGSDKERGLMQDYQMEVYYERAPRETVHFYVIWRDMIYTSSIDFDSESAQRLVIDGLYDWDEEAEEWCNGER